MFLCTLVIALGTSLTGCTQITKEAAGLKAEQYLGKYILKDGIKAHAKESKDLNGFYVVTLDVKKDDQVLDNVKVFVTKNGETMSLGPIFNLNQAPPSPEEQKQAAAQGLPKKDKPEVRLFVMAGCPYGVQAETSFAPVIKALGDTIDFTPNFVIYSNAGEGQCIDKGQKYCSMHGADEAKEDVRQICVWNGQKEKWWDYVSKFNTSCYEKGDFSEACSKDAAKGAGIDFAKVEKCVKESTNTFLDKEIELGKKYDAQGSPTIIINGTAYQGGRSPNDVLAAICSTFNKKPAACDIKLDGGDKTAQVQGGCGK